MVMSHLKRAAECEKTAGERSWWHEMAPEGFCREMLAVSLVAR